MMLYHLFTAWADVIGPFRVFRYPSFRIPAAALTALVLMLWLFPRFIEFLRSQQHGVSNVREDTPEQHQVKRGTPTMGGVFILITLMVSTLLWADLSNIFVWAVLLVTAGFGAIGFIDDYRKVKKKDSKGLPGRKKLLYQVFVLGGLTAFLMAARAGYFGTPIELDTTVSLPFVSVKLFNPDIGWLYVPFAFLVVMGTSHAVNLTDGLDGLAIGPTVVSASTFMILAYIAGLVLGVNAGGTYVEFNAADYLNLVHIEGMGELAILCAAIAGAGIGFLWFNTFPASVFMGDVGSLALGGALGAIAVLTKNEFLSAIIHGVFLVEVLSVITQVASFKLTGKRVFRMAPIHHHFELKGWAEPKIIVRFWIASIILALVGLVTLKLR
ncbi:MAG: phospho-N-acetylmuramoyl-pentapeptide-transferase [Deltaproteobacteria bacterium]|nr:phospho-N-acetylmuramoyl-pentapeptide-transferase [Deltaproteobacteria bacterium]MBT6433555.1 phospho-N-acetylmuramoyl-pentapeptide-transferase [Deltaproteobacteria bacterium]MBT6490080.1 phospho-N-acetylmuramoyl-pentapeptide-transferase [Deltaproteobacteria bacterium]